LREFKATFSTVVCELELRCKRRGCMHATLFTTIAGCPYLGRQNCPFDHQAWHVDR
jgi:hypothetical protein